MSASLGRGSRAGLLVSQLVTAHLSLTLAVRSIDVCGRFQLAVVQSHGWHPALGNGGTATRHMPIQRRGTAPDLSGDFGGGHGAGCQHRLRRPDLDGVQCRRTTTNSATGTAGCQRSPGALTQKLHLELPEGSEDVEDQPPGRAGGVDVLVQRSQPDAACLQGVHRGKKLAHRSRQSIQSGDDQHVSFADEVEPGGKLWAIGTGAAHRFLEHPLAPGRMERVDLTVRGLQIGRDAGIADQHQKSPKTRPTPEQSGRGFQD